MSAEIDNAIRLLAEGKNLGREQSTRVFQIILLGGATPAQIAALLMGLHNKGEIIDEIAGAAITLRAKMEKITAPAGAIDVCGTGGDNKGSLNVSTAVALVVAGSGVPVAKHGNRSVSSKSGSADILSALGVNIQAEPKQMQQALEEAKICFLYAPLYHKAMRHVAPIRQELGIRTIFNLVGPLINPALPEFQLMGVYDKALVEPIAQVLHTLGSKAAWVVHGSDGMDELTITGTSYVVELKEGTVRSFEVTPEDAGLERADAESLQGKDPEHNAHELRLLLAGKKSPYRDIVVLNTAAALVIAGNAADLRAGAELAAEAIDNGNAAMALAHLVRISSGVE